MATNTGKESRKLREMLSRRQVLGMMGTTELGTLAAGCGAGAIASQTGTTTVATSTAGAAGGTTALMPSCILTPEVTEGPYYRNLLRIRDDITEDVVRNEEDNIFQQAGEGSIVTLTGSVEEGFVAEITLGVDPNATPDPAGMGALPDTGGEAP